MACTYALGNIEKIEAGKIYEPEDQRVCYEMCLLVASETTQIKSHQHDFLNMSWTRMKINMVKWVEKARKSMKSEQVHKEHTVTQDQLMKKEAISLK